MEVWPEVGWLAMMNVSAANITDRSARESILGAEGSPGVAGAPRRKSILVRSLEIRLAHLLPQSLPSYSGVSKITSGARLA